VQLIRSESGVDYPRGEPRGIRSASSKQAAQALALGRDDARYTWQSRPKSSDSDRPGKISVFPQFPAPQPLFQSRELAEQAPPTVALDDPHDLPYRSRWWKRYQKMDVLFLNFHFQNFDPVRLADLPDYLFRPFPDFLPLEDLLPVFWTPHQMIAGVVDRMTRPLDAHASFISYCRARAYADKGGFPAPL
jgi:hypothetical protein